MACRHGYAALSIRTYAGRMPAPFSLSRHPPGVAALCLAPSRSCLLCVPRGFMAWAGLLVIAGTGLALYSLPPSPSAPSRDIWV